MWESHLNFTFEGTTALIQHAEQSEAKLTVPSQKSQKPWATLSVSPSDMDLFGDKSPFFSGECAPGYPLP